VDSQNETKNHKSLSSSVCVKSLSVLKILIQLHFGTFSVLFCQRIHVQFGSIGV